MLKTTLDFNRNETVTLIPNSGVQFLNFAFDIAEVERLSRLVTYERDAVEDNREDLVLYPVRQDSEGLRLYRPRGSAAEHEADEECTYSMKAEAALSRLGSNLNTILAEVERERIAISRANSRVRDLQAQQRLSETQSRTLSREIAALNGDVNRLQSSSGNPAQQAQLRQQIAQRKAAINAYAKVAVF
ncbi:MAG: virulence factor SrfB [Paracoccus sp. (in: a-proteobacteria)]|uniref:virulence factor SrfB n=1 Tax=Paracoccus sp. TaxID=267 RepID=UPI0039E21A80